MKTIIQIIRSAENAKDKNSTYYQTSIIKNVEAAGYSAEVTVVSNYIEYDIAISRSVPTLVLEPCEFIGSPIFNAEQNQTARAISNAINANGKQASVLIINRSKLIGRPLADMLLQDDHTVAIAHSKTPITKIRDLAKVADFVVTATGMNLQNVVGDIKGPLFLDPSNDLKGNKHVIEDMRSIGQATTNLLIKDCIDLTELIESKGWNK